jgi:hypothetical protein
MSNGGGVPVTFGSGISGIITPERSPAQLLDDVSAFIRRFVHLVPEQATVVTLWSVHTHGLKHAITTPYLSITSAEKRSGKTRLLEVLELLVARPWLTGRVTAASLIRKIDRDHPTLLLDESDAAFNGDKQYAETLRGVLNSGHRRGGSASCCVGQGSNIAVKDFQTFGAKAIAGIGKLPDTVADRSFHIRLKRKGPREKVDRFRPRLVKPQADALKKSLETWAGQLKDLPDPSLPDALTDRQQDGAEPLLAIADAVGGDWPQRARQALLKICGEQAADDQSNTVLLLSDIRDIFRAGELDRIFSKGLIDQLVQLETSPWAEWKHGKPLSQIGLSRLLKGFDIGPNTVRIDENTAKGYSREQFTDVFERYLPPYREIDPSHPSQLNIHAGPEYFSEPSQKESVTGRKSEESPMFTRVVTGVTAQIPGEGHGNTKTLHPAGGEKLCSKHGFHSEWFVDQDGVSICGKCHSERTYNGTSLRGMIL